MAPCFALFRPRLGTKHTARRADVVTCFRMWRESLSSRLVECSLGTLWSKCTPFLTGRAAKVARTDKPHPLNPLQSRDGAPGYMCLHHFFRIFCLPTNASCASDKTVTQLFCGIVMSHVNKYVCISFPLFLFLFCQAANFNGG